ncbi:MAG: DNA-deoxyinosine glycosylase [Burkholderiales bacterium]|nr:DNA-deoxyinosine glycosylase [Burkholderiales bacterium]
MNDSSAPDPQAVPLLRGFAPVIADDTHTLILGSFPGEASLQAQQYYAFRHNQFWRLLSAVLDAPLADMPYQQRLAHLLAAGIGLWDIFHSCVREGSLDSAIRDGKLNDFSSLQQTHPQLRRLCFNGKTAGKMQAYFNKNGYQTLVLPSSSPAHATLRFEDKLREWRRLLA